MFRVAHAACYRTRCFLPPKSREVCADRHPFSGYSDVNGLPTRVTSRLYMRLVCNSVLYVWCTDCVALQGCTC